MTSRKRHCIFSYASLRRSYLHEKAAVLFAAICLLVAVKSAVGEYADVVLSDHPVAYWRFEETRGMVAADSVQRSSPHRPHHASYHHASLGHPSATAMLGRAVRLDGGREGASSVRLETPEVLWSGRNMTIEWWQLAEQIVSDHALFCWAASGESEQDVGAIAVSIRRTLVDAERNRYRSRFRIGPVGDEGDASAVESRTPVFPGQWYHVAIVFHAEDATVELFINGQPDGRPVNVEELLVETLQPSEGRAVIGRLVGQEGWRFTGLVDEVAIYRKALSARRLQAHFRAAVAASGHIERVKTIAHRGSSRMAPENTLLAFRKAVEAGSEIVELDVAASRDAVPVVIHDKTVDRTTNGQGEVKGLTAKELSRLDAGSWMAPEFAGERLPTLAQAARLLNGSAVIALDLKADGLGQGIARVLRESGLPSDGVIVGPWSDQQAADIRAFMPDVPMVLIGGQPEPADAMMFSDMKGKGYTGFWLKWSTVTRSFIDQAHRRGMPVYVWTINDPPTLSAAILAGVDGIITDEPLRLKRLLSDLRGRR